MLLAQVGAEIPWATLFNFGLTPIFVFALMLTGWLYPKPMIDYLHRQNSRLQDDNEKLREENRELRTGIEDRVVPALVRVTDLMDKMASK